MCRKKMQVLAAHPAPIEQGIRRIQVCTNQLLSLARKSRNWKELIQIEPTEVMSSAAGHALFMDETLDSAIPQQHYAYAMTRDGDDLVRLQVSEVMTTPHAAGNTEIIGGQTYNLRGYLHNQKIVKVVAPKNQEGPLAQLTSEMATVCEDRARQLKHAIESDGVPMAVPAESEDVSVWSVLPLQK